MGIDAGTSGRRSGAESEWRIDFLSVGIMGRCVWCAGIENWINRRFVISLFRCDCFCFSVIICAFFLFVSSNTP